MTAIPFSVPRIVRANVAAADGATPTATLAAAKANGIDRENEVESKCRLDVHNDAGAGTLTSCTVHILYFNKRALKWVYGDSVNLTQFPAAVIVEDIAGCILYPMITAMLVDGGGTIGIDYSVGG